MTVRRATWEQILSVTDVTAVSRCISDVKGEFSGVLTPFQLLQRYVKAALNVFRPVSLYFADATAFTMSSLTVNEVDNAGEILGEIFLSILVLQHEVSVADETHSRF